MNVLFLQEEHITLGGQREKVCLPSLRYLLKYILRTCTVTKIVRGT